MTTFPQFTGSVNSISRPMLTTSPRQSSSVSEARTLVDRFRRPDRQLRPRTSFLPFTHPPPQGPRGVASCMMLKLHYGRPTGPAEPENFRKYLSRTPAHPSPLPAEPPRVLGPTWVLQLPACWEYVPARRPILPINPG
ncbi:hypothetical protein GQ53DRAFT_273104 [Thozetella sp. PMI_491]|nr:hypothetical protein GQ53DRAFT_273104 [Thozetella sp. PMI_491]